jgi:uncharacterized repeat protein (TIGR01451 family)
MVKVSKVLYAVMLAAVVFALSGCYSCRTHWKAKGRKVPPDVAYSMYWDKDCVPLPESVPPPPIPETTCGPYQVQRTYPVSGVYSTDTRGMVRIEKSVPDQIQMNSPFEYTIRVTNVSGVMVDDLKVMEHTSENFAFVKSDPMADQEGSTLMWSLGALEAGASREIVIHGKATTADCVKQCADVTYNIPACTFVKVVQPLLALSKTAPSRTLLCDEIPLTFRVENKGSGNADNVTIVDELPADLITQDGSSRVDISVGTLEPGESKEYTVITRAQDTGTFTSKAMARAEGGLRSESDITQTVVTQPELRISKTGPDHQYFGKKVTYTITVTNVGDSPSSNTVLEDKVPVGVTNIVTSNGGSIRGSSVVWDLGTIGIDRSKEVTISYVPARTGTLSSKATAMATCAEGVTAMIDTSIAGIPAILLEVIDIADPIEVGNEESYLITVTNQGTEVDTNIVIKCFLESNMKYVSSSGSTKVAFANGTVTFNPVEKLEPGDKASWKINVRAMSPGDVRFKATMTSDELGREVMETEATRFYE